MNERTKIQEKRMKAAPTATPSSSFVPRQHVQQVMLMSQVRVCIYTLISTYVFLSLLRNIKSEQVQVIGDFILDL